VSNAPSRGHSCTISFSAADRNALATRAAAAVLDVASAAMRRPPGRRHGTSAAIQRAASSSCKPPTFSTTSAGRTDRPSGSSAPASATSRARFCLLAQLRAGGPTLPSTLTAPGALTTVEGAGRALAAAPWPAGFATTLAREVDTLVPEPGARYAVRSSASIEDEAGALAAGLFLSR